MALVSSSNTNIIYIFLLVIFLILICVSIITIYILKILNKRRLEHFLKKLADNENYSFTKVKDMPYDYRLELKYNIYYIKLLYIPNNNDLIIKDKDDWFIRNTQKKKFIKLKNISKMIDFKVENERLKNSVKLFIIYPSYGNIIKYLNLYESEFVYPENDVYSTRIILAKDIYEDSDLLE